MAGDCSPWTPSPAIEPCGQTKLALHSSWQNDGLKRIEENEENDHDADNGGENLHVWRQMRWDGSRFSLV
jgi:hypothetical protein